MSECIFICTSNSVANMLGPLIDRIEVIHVPAYLPIEKLNIAKQYLIPDLEKEYAFQKQILSDQEEDEATAGAETADVQVDPADALQAASHEKMTLTDASIMDIIQHYCSHEAGVRNLKKALDRIFRKVVAKLESQPGQQEESKEESLTDSVEY